MSTDALIEYERRIQSGEISRPKPRNPQERHERDPNSRAKAIAAKCWDCTCQQREEIRNCVMTDCALYNFRPYK